MVVDSPWMTLSARKMKVLISNDCAYLHKMIVNSFDVSGMVLAGYRLTVDDKIWVRIVATHKSAMIWMYFVVELSHLHRFLRPMVLDMTCHVAMSVRHFDCNVDNREELLEMARNCAEMNFR